MNNQLDSSTRPTDRLVNNGFTAKSRLPISFFNGPGLLRLIYQNWLAATDSTRYARSIGVHVGRNCHLWASARRTFGSEPYLIHIGDNVSITHDCMFITNDQAIRLYDDQFQERELLAPIVIGDNVFIGAHTVILAGVTIGDNCVIGAGALVSRNIAPNSLALGNPARRIKSVEEYWQGVKDRTVPTFRLDPMAKRRYLENHYRQELSGD